MKQSSVAPVTGARRRRFLGILGRGPSLIDASSAAVATGGLVGVDGILFVLVPDIKYVCVFLFLSLVSSLSFSLSLSFC